MATSTRDWQARMQKRNNLAMSMLKRPSQSDIRSSITSSEQPSSCPISPTSSHSAGASSQSSIDEAFIMESQLKKNQAQIKANEERMRILQAADDRMGRDIQDRMSVVMQLNQQLSIMRDMLARAERVSKGEFGVELEDS